MTLHHFWRRVLVAGLPVGLRFWMPVREPLLGGKGSAGGGGGGREKDGRFAGRG